MKVKEKILISVLGISVIGMILNPIKSKAALQANGNGNSTATINEWLINIRKMEATGGTLGLEAGINGNLTDSGTSNNLDIHMQKNTEYGAMAILSASAYGNQAKITGVEDETNGVKYKTTTGNKSGIYITLNKEWVSAGNNDNNGSNYLGNNVENFRNALEKYKNIYTKDYSVKAKIGDAVAETVGWHGSNNSKWFQGNSTSGLLRAYSDSIFSYYGYSYYDRVIYDAHYSKGWSSRAVIVVGKDF